MVYVVKRGQRTVRKAIRWKGCEKLRVERRESASECYSRMYGYAVYYCKACAVLDKSQQTRLTRERQYDTNQNCISQTELLIRLSMA